MIKVIQTNATMSSLVVYVTKLERNRSVSV